MPTEESVSQDNQPDFTVPETEEEALELIEQVEEGETVLEVEVKGSSAFQDGRTDRVRRYNDKLLLENIIGQTVNMTDEEAASNLVEKELGARVIEIEEVDDGV